MFAMLSHRKHCRNPLVSVSRLIGLSRIPGLPRANPACFRLRLTRLRRTSALRPKPVTGRADESPAGACGAPYCRTAPLSCTMIELTASHDGPSPAFARFHTLRPSRFLHCSRRVAGATEPTPTVPPPTTVAHANKRIDVLLHSAYAGNQLLRWGERDVRWPRPPLLRLGAPWVSTATTAQHVASVDVAVSVAAARGTLAGALPSRPQKNAEPSR